MTARIANAGHEPPLKRTPECLYESFEAEAPPLGIAVAIIPEDGYPEFDIRLDGGALHLVSDGVTEGKLAGGDMLGADGVRKILDENANMSLSKRPQSVAAGLNRGGNLHDDIIILGSIPGPKSWPSRATILCPSSAPKARWCSAYRCRWCSNFRP